MDYKMVQTEYILRDNKWIETGERATKMVDTDFVVKFAEAKQFMINLGGKEIHKKLPKHGLQVTSISPERNAKVITVFTLLP